MLASQKNIQATAVMVIIIFSFAWCQENERRAVTEQQLMHDRGRAMQSLKRLRWLSSTMEGLHTAQIRTPEMGPADCRARATREVLLSRLERGPKSSTLGSLLRVLGCSVRKPHPTGLPASQK